MESPPASRLTRQVTLTLFGHLTRNESFGARSGQAVGASMKNLRVAAEVRRSFSPPLKRKYQTTGPAMDSSLFMNRLIQRRNGISQSFGLQTKPLHLCCSRISMNVRHSSHPTENISRTLLTNLARPQSMCRRFRFQVVSGGSQPALAHNQDGDGTVANFSISVLTGS